MIRTTVAHVTIPLPSVGVGGMVSEGSPVAQDLIHVAYEVQANANLPKTFAPDSSSCHIVLR